MTSLRGYPLSIYYLILFAGLVSATIAAHASHSNEPRTIAVRFADLKVNTPDGVVAVYNRIERAARQVCGTDDLSGLRLMSDDWQSCVSSSIARAIREVNAPLLSAYSTERHRRKSIAAATGLSR